MSTSSSAERHKRVTVSVDDDIDPLVDQQVESAVHKLRERLAEAACFCRAVGSCMPS